MLARAGISNDVNGLFYGNPGQLVSQAISVIAAGGYSFITTFVILKLVDAVIGLRVTTEEEEVGLDLTQHGERGYLMGVGELMLGTPIQRPLPLLSEMAVTPEDETVRV